MSKCRINGCEVELINYDTVDCQARKKASELVKSMSRHNDLLKILIESVYHYKVNVYNPCDKRFCDYIDKKIIVNENFRDELTAFKIEFVKLLMVEGCNMGKIQSFMDYSNKVRGNVIEYILNRKAQKENEVHHYGCYVVIDKCKMTYLNKMTVDYAGHNYKRFQFYECKVSPNNFSEEAGINQVNLLLNIKDTLCEKTIDSEIFCVTAGSRYSLLKQLKDNFEMEQILKVNVIGDNELIN